MNKKILFIALFAFTFNVFSYAQTENPTLKILKEELNRNFTVLSNETIPAYYIRLTLNEDKSQSCSASMGFLQTKMQDVEQSNSITSTMRVGTPNLDNTHIVGNNYSQLNTQSSTASIDANPEYLKREIWLQLDGLYKSNVGSLEVIKSKIAVNVPQEDKSPDFSEEIAEKYFEAPIEYAQLDKSEWEQKMKKYSGVFNQNSDISDAYASFNVNLNRKYIVDSEGREIVQNESSYSIVIMAQTVAEDGMELPLAKTWFARSLDRLPSDQEIMDAVKWMSETLTALKKAPVAESYTGPAILSPAASGVFFHEIFGHRVEGSRLKQESDAQTFKKKIGDRVLQKSISITFDPTLKRYNNIDLNGTYVYDDEGIKGQKVEVVKNGILENFLMSRTPIDGFLHSNGHGRAEELSAPMSRQSNMLVESTQKYTDQELRKKLIKEAKSQHKKYGYLFQEVSGGFTNTNRYSPNSFNVSPLLVYRVFVDGSPEELVRGISLVGTPLSMFSQIAACGEDYGVFNGICGAESGSVPVSCIAPEIMVKRIETQKVEKSQMLPPILSKPVAEINPTDTDDIILGSIKKEVDRNLAELNKSNLGVPFFISYSIFDAQILSISASLGSVLGSSYSPSRSQIARLLMGDYNCTDENFYGSGSYAGNRAYVCEENNEAGIRYSIWKNLDALYKESAETYQQKLATIKRLDIPKADLDLPDFDKSPTVKLIDKKQINIDFDKKKYEDYCKSVSSVFKGNKDILSSTVYMTIYNSKSYMYNTEKTEYELPLAVTNFTVEAYAMTKKGEYVSSSFDEAYFTPDELPSVEEMKAKCTDLINKTIAKKNAEKMSESYTGPVMFEKKAAVGVFYGNFFSGDMDLVTYRKQLTDDGYSDGGNDLEEMIGKKVSSKELSVEDLTGTQEYNGQKLIGYTPIDGDGVVPPAKLVLIENGILKTLLNNRVPTEKVRQSNGHSLVNFGSNKETTTGVIRMSYNIKKDSDSLKQELLKRAKEEGYEYAYIVRDLDDNGSSPSELYQVSVKDGSEKFIRSAQINNVSAEMFKKIIAVSNKEYIYNNLRGERVTIITPEDILFDDITVQKMAYDNYEKPPIVSQSE